MKILNSLITESTRNLPLKNLYEFLKKEAHYLRNDGIYVSYSDGYGNGEVRIISENDFEITISEGTDDGEYSFYLVLENASPVEYYFSSSRTPKDIENVIVDIHEIVGNYKSTTNALKEIQRLDFFDI